MGEQAIACRRLLFLPLFFPGVEPFALVGARHAALRILDPIQRRADWRCRQASANPLSIILGELEAEIIAAKLLGDDQSAPAARERIEYQLAWIRRRFDD